MPELPEVETIRSGLARHLDGARVAGVHLAHPRVSRRHSAGPSDLARRLRGRYLKSVVRRGKYLWFLLDDDEALLVHLGMSGQLLISDEPARPSSHLRASLRLADDRVLSVVDQRTFGHLMVTNLVDTADGGAGGHGASFTALPAPIAHIARDPLDPQLAQRELSLRMRRRHSEIKRALLDQSLISGVGNIYADEALWRARLHPRRSAHRLNPSHVTTLLAAVRRVMTEALAAGGTSFDALYVDVSGAAGYFSHSLDVYGRAGLPCRRCGTPLVRESFTNRSSTFCRRCQPAPRPRK